MDLAQGLEGLIRQTGVHAAGVIMSAEPLTDHIPIMRRDTDGVIITQFDYPTCETLGLLKMDFLGLRNLTIIDDALKAIKLNKGEDIDLLELPLDDRKTYELLARGDTLGVFQLDGGGMRSLLRLMRPDNFEDISAALALYRPGPMGANSHTNYALRKNGQQEITPIHPELEEPLKEILGTTHGLIVYQEQVMAIAQKVAGLHASARPTCCAARWARRRSPSWTSSTPSFEQGMKDNGYSAAAIKALWDILLPFSDYAFNKAHTAAYGLVSYWTAYLKANYPAEYMAAPAHLGQGRQGQERALPQRVPPHGHQGAAAGRQRLRRRLHPAGDTEIRFGLSAIRNVGGNVVDGDHRGAQGEGPLHRLQGLPAQGAAAVCNKRVVESLIKAGAFDELGHERKAW